MKNQIDKETLKLILERPVAYHPKLALALGSINLAILISQLIYWTGKQENEDGWIYKTQREITEETALSRRENDTARKLGKKLGILQEENRGLPAKMHYKIDMDMIHEILRTMHKSAKLYAQKRQTSLHKSAKLSITEITTESTTSVASDEDFSFQRELDLLKNGGESGKRKDFKIIALYWKHKGWVFENKEQFNAALVRELKPAKMLKGYTGIQIATAVKHCKDKYPEWTLETLHKCITDLVNVR